MSCEHCDDGRLLINFCPQLGIDADNGFKLYAYTLVKGIFGGPDGPMWAEVHVPSPFQADPLEGAKVSSCTRARFCPVCGGEI